MTHETIAAAIFGTAIGISVTLSAFKLERILNRKTPYHRSL